MNPSHWSRRFKCLKKWKLIFRYFNNGSSSVYQPNSILCHSIACNLEKRVCGAWYRRWRWERQLEEVKIFLLVDLLANYGSLWTHLSYFCNYGLGKMDRFRYAWLLLKFSLSFHWLFPLSAPTNQPTCSCYNFTLDHFYTWAASQTVFWVNHLGPIGINEARQLTEAV